MPQARTRAGGQLLAARSGRQPTARYNGYTACPLVNAHNLMLVAEFDYELKPTPTLPLVNTMKPRYDMWLLKRPARRCSGPGADLSQPVPLDRRAGGRAGAGLRGGVAHPRRLVT